MYTFSILDRYIGKTIFITVVIVLFVLISLSGIIKFVEQVKKTGQGNYNAAGAGMYTLLSVPKDIQMFFPMAVLLGTMLGLSILAQHSELVAMQASGYARAQVVFSVMKIAVPLVLLTIAIGEWIAPRCEQIARNYRTKAIYGSSLLSKKQKLWVKDGQNFIYIECIMNRNKLNGVSIYSFNEKHHLHSIRCAEVAKFDPESKFWQLSQVNEFNFQDSKQIASSKIVSDIWKTNLTPDKLSVIAFNPDALSISALFNYIKYLQLSGQDTKRYQLNMWNKIFQPILIVVMMLIALSFMFGPLRDVTMSIRVMVGISFGFIFYVLDQIFSPVTLVFGIPPIIGALLPIVSYFLIIFWLFLRYF